MPLTEKENFLKVIHGETPEWVPRYTFGPDPHATKPQPSSSYMVNAIPSSFTPGQPFTDMFGVTYVSSAQTSGTSLPEPNNFILDDVRNWDKVLKVPDYIKPANEYDWDALAKAALAPIDREQKAVSAMMGDMPFMLITSLMGFTEGLCALVEEPEVCAEMFDWLADFYEPYILKTMDYVQPDIWSMGDDNASKYAPFFSLETYRQVFKPIHARYAKVAKERGIPVHFHDCGKCELFLDDYVDIGVKYWDPAQTTNDLLAIKEKFKGRLVVVGGFDFVPDINYNQVSEEYIREFTRSVIDKLAPGGGYAFLGGYLGAKDELDVAYKINTWINQEVESYGYHFYDK